jgi:hypothetical protein
MEIPIAGQHDGGNMKAAYGKRHRADAQPGDSGEARSRCCADNNDEDLRNLQKEPRSKRDRPAALPSYLV